MCVGVFRAHDRDEKKRCESPVHYWLINTVATAVPLSAHPSPLVITTKLAAAILGVPLFGGGALPAQYYPCGLGRSSEVQSYQRIYGKNLQKL